MLYLMAAMISSIKFRPLNNYLIAYMSLVKFNVKFLFFQVPPIFTWKEKKKLDTTRVSYRGFEEECMT